MTKTAAVVGAGISGLGASLALARQGYEVSIFERDSSPPQGDGDEAFIHWKRSGAGQFRHPHGLLGLLCNILQDNYPDLLQDLMNAGARRVDFQEMLSPTLKKEYVPIAEDERVWVLACRRATLETVLRRYVERQANIELKSEQIVSGVVSKEDGDQLTVTGLQLGEDEIHTDIVVDASGRTSPFRRWFKALGRDIREEKESAEIVYFTRHYKLKPGAEEPSRDGPERIMGDLGYLTYGLFISEHGHFAVIICVPVAEKKLRKAVNNSDQFHQICQSIPGLAPWLKDDVSVPTTESFGFADINAAWRHYVEDDTPVALNFFSVGDSACRTNPQYGRGCSTGMLQAHILADVVTSESDPLKRAIEFNNRTMDEIRPIYNASLDQHKRSIQQAAAIREGRIVEKSGGFKQWFTGAFGDAMAAAITNELHVARGFSRHFHLLEKPGKFLKDRRIRNTVFRYMLRGRKKNAAARIVNGPDRNAMLKLLEE